MASLYNLSIEFLQVAQQLEEMELDQETLADTLESLQIPIEEKAENVIKFAKNLEAMAEARKTEAKRLTEQAAKDAKKAERLLSYLDDAMRMLNKKKLTAGVFEVGYKKGLEVVKVDETRLPKEYWLSQKPKPMGKPELKKLVKDGVEIEGVTLERNPDKLTIK